MLPFPAANVARKSRPCSRAFVDLTIRGEALRSLTAFAALPAIAFFAVVHGTVLAALFAAWLVRRKCYRADRGCENRKQNFRAIFHVINLARDVIGRNGELAPLALW